jgi:hypothetical protein
MIPYPTVVSYKDASRRGWEVSLSLSEVVSDFAVAFKAVDEMRPQGASRTRTYRPGIGPLTQADAVSRALQHLNESNADLIHQNQLRPVRALPQTLPCPFLAGLMLCSSTA